MNLKALIGRLGLMACLALFGASAQATMAPEAAPAKPDPIKPVDAKKCYSCHDNIEEFHTGGRHATVNCAHCHDAVAHLKTAKNSSMGERPVTSVDHRACATCHTAQYNSFVQMNMKSGARVEKAAWKSRSPMFDKLMEGYGFTIEHAEPRSHAFMLVDHLAVDRAYGGRFEFKDWTYVTKAEEAANGSWNVLRDLGPDNNDHKPNRFKPLTLPAANPVCLNCKSQDHILDWKYMGDADPKAKWARTSNTADFARFLKHPLNCFMCHDPHSAAPRVVRDGLINAVVDRGLGTYPQDPAKSAQITMKKVTFERGGKEFRAIGMLSKSDSNLMCAQCHVEYNCGPGFDLGDKATGKEPSYITMADPRTNFFPWTNVLGYKDRMVKEKNFKDFKHANTGALLAKIQHPETETFWGSKHERKGVECKDCHMPKVKPADGKVYTSHAQKSPREQIKAACLGCHKEWSEEEAVYQIDAIQNYTRGKMIKAEFWIAQLIDEMVAAKRAGVAKEILEKAKETQYDATLFWEWWTAENSDGFHNPDLARESMVRSITAAKAGVAELRKAIADLKH